jgi:hypothetical protein
MMRTNADALPTINAEFFGDYGFSISNSDGLCWASFNAIDAAHA